MRLCLNKLTCRKYHLPGTKRELEKNKNAKRDQRNSNDRPNRDQRNSDDRPNRDQRNTRDRPNRDQRNSDNQTPPPQMWNSSQTPTSQQNHNNGGQESFLTYLNQIKVDMQTQMREQEEMNHRMKEDIESSVKSILREAMQQKLPAEQKLIYAQPAYTNLQNAQTHITTSANPGTVNLQSQAPQSMQTYQTLYPMMIPDGPR